MLANKSTDRSGGLHSRRKSLFVFFTYVAKWVKEERKQNHMESEFASYDMNLRTYPKELRYIVFDYLPPLFQGRTFSRHWLVDVALYWRRRRRIGVQWSSSKDCCCNRFLSSTEKCYLYARISTRLPSFACLFNFAC